MKEDNREQRVHYIHRTSYSFQERVVGLFVLIAFAIVFGLLLINSKTAHLFDDSVKYHAYLKSAEGISAETVVKVSGLDVGRVINFDVAEDNRIHVTFEVFERYQKLIRADSKASVGKLSVLGKSTIDITAGTTTADMLPDGAFINVAEPMSVDELIAQMTPVVEGITSSIQRLSQVIETIEPQKIRGTVDDLAGTARNVRSITDQLAAGKGAVGTALYDRDFEQKMRGSVAELERTLGQANQRLAELRPVVEGLNTMSGDSQQLVKELPELVRESTDLVKQVKVTVTTFNAELKEFPDLVSRMKVLMDQTEQTMQSITSMWPLSAGAAPSPAVQIEAQPAR